MFRIIIGGFVFIAILMAGLVDARYEWWGSHSLWGLWHPQDRFLIPASAGGTFLIAAVFWPHSTWSVYSRAIWIISGWGILSLVAWYVCLFYDIARENTLNPPHWLMWFDFASHEAAQHFPIAALSALVSGGVFVALVLFGKAIDAQSRT